MPQTALARAGLVRAGSQVVLHFTRPRRQTAAPYLQLMFGPTCSSALALAHEVVSIQNQVVDLHPFVSGFHNYTVHTCSYIIYVSIDVHRNRFAYGCVFCIIVYFIPSHIISHTYGCVCVIVSKNMLFSTMADVLNQSCCVFERHHSY